MLHQVGIEIVAKDNKMKASLSQLIRQLEKLNVTQSKNVKNQRELNNIEKQTARNQNQTVSSMRRKNTELEKTNRHLQKQNGLSKLSSRLGIKGGLAGLGRNLLAPVAALAGGAAIIGGVRRAGVNSFARQEQQTQVENIVGRNLTRGESGRIGDLATQSGQSKEDLLQSFYNYFSITGNTDFDEAEAFLGQASKFATGGGAKSSDFTRALLQVQAQDETLNVEDAAKSVFGAVQVGDLDLQDVADNVGKFLGTATKAGGFDVAEASTLFAELSRSLPTEMAATAVKSISAELAKPSANAKKFGINAQNNEKEGLVGTLKRIQEAEASGLTVFDLFGKETASALSQLPKDLTKMEQSLSNFNRADPLKNFANAQDDVNFKTRQLKSEIANTADEIFQSKEIMALFNGVLNVAVGALDVFQAGLKGIGNVRETVLNAFGIKTGEQKQETGETALKNKISESISDEQLLQYALETGGKHGLLESSVFERATGQALGGNKLKNAQSVIAGEGNEQFRNDVVTEFFKVATGQIEESKLGEKANEAASGLITLDAELQTLAISFRNASQKIDSSGPSGNPLAFVGPLPNLP